MLLEIPRGHIVIANSLKQSNWRAVKELYVLLSKNADAIECVTLLHKIEKQELPMQLNSSVCVALCGIK